MSIKLCMLMCVCGVALGACASAKHFVGADQCMVPTPREAKITKRVWM